MVRGGRRGDGRPSSASPAGAGRFGRGHGSLPGSLPRRQRRRLDPAVAPGGPHLHGAFPHSDRHQRVSSTSIRFHPLPSASVDGLFNPIGADQLIAAVMPLVAGRWR